MWLLVLLVLAVLFIVVSTAWYQVHPFLALLAAAFGYGIFCGTLSPADVVASVNEGFGVTLKNIGIVIVAGTIVGVFLEKSGGALRLSETILRWTGEKNVPLTMSLVGYIVSIPVFCDSGFVILSPLNHALTWRAKASLAGSAVALSLGLYATHTMVPPTPGPVAAAGILGADLGLVIMYGMVVSAAAMAVGWLFAVRYAARIQIDPGTTDEGGVVQSGEDAPSPAKSILPILVPIFLIVLKSIAEYETHPMGEGPVVQLLEFIGHPSAALLIGVGLALLLPKRFDRKMLSSGGWVGEAIASSAAIIIITGAGGAFGKVLQNSGIADSVESLLGGVPIGIWLPFLIAAALKTAQGSSTVSMLTTAGIVGPMLNALQLDTPVAKALVVVAIGAGSMVVSHANDSYFWVVTQFSKMNVKQGYQLQTLGTLVEGVAAAVTVWLVSLVLL